MAIQHIVICFLQEILHMSKPPTFKVTEVGEAIGAERHTLQRWADSGILSPLAETATAGRGVHRRFSIAEVLVAAVLAKLARFEVSIGQIKRLGVEIRRQMFELEPGARWPGDGDTQWINAFENTLGDGQVWIIIASRPPRTVEPTVVVETGEVPNLSKNRPGIGPLINFPMIVIINLGEVWRSCFALFKAHGYPSR